MMTEENLSVRSIVGHATDLRGPQLIVKRSLDIVVASVLLGLLSPILAIAAICIWISSPGPILFRQERCGWRGTTFICLKFRTMFVNSEVVASAHSLGTSQPGLLVKMKNDPRVTPIGAFLRRTSIDELPQLINVLLGEMSMVGPRPLMLHMLAPYPELRCARGQVRPGITCLWQISARDQNTSALQMMPYDLQYIREFSLWLDFKILLRTPAAVFSGRGAH